MKRTGFTLVELLVVMGIFAFLMGVPMSVLRFVREKARVLKCQTHIDGLTDGCIFYSMDNDRFPSGLTFSFNTISDLGVDPLGRWWFERIGQKPRKFDIVHTPLQCPSKQLDSVRLKYNKLWSNYGVNWSIFSSLDGYMPPDTHDFAKTSLTYDAFRRHSEALLMVDSGYSLIGWQHALSPAVSFKATDGALATSYIPGLSVNKHRDLHPVQEHDAIEGRHLKRTVNIGFADGHVENKLAEDLLVEQTPEGNYINRSPLWKPR